MRRVSPPVALALVTAVGLAGCAFARPAAPTATPALVSPSAAPPWSSPPRTTAMIDIATRSGSWPGTQNELETAINKLNRLCLAAQGFNPPEAPSPAYPVPEDEAAAIDLATRAKVGYATTTGDSDQTKASQHADLFYERLPATEKQRYSTALFGPPNQRTRIELGDGRYVTVRSDGCEAASRRKLAGDVGTWARLTYLPQTLDDRLAKQAASTSTYMTALASWHTCMAARGYPHQTPQQARVAVEATYRQPANQTVLRAQEIATAVADGECSLQVHLFGAELMSRRNLVTTLPAADLRVLAELAERRDAAIARAQPIVHP